MAEAQGTNANGYNYFTCTLGEAASLAGKPTAYETVTELIDRQARINPRRYAVGFPVPPDDDTHCADLPWECQLYTFDDLKENSIETGQYLFHHMMAEWPDARGRTVAFLCPSSPAFLFGWLGLVRLGFAVLLIASECQPAAIVHLCNISRVDFLIYHESYTSRAEASRDKSYASQAFELVCLPEVRGYKVPLNGHGGVKHHRRPWAHIVGKFDIAYIHHTSGTSGGLPKTNPISNHHAVGVLPTLIDGADRATFSTTPLYSGGVADCFRAWTSDAMVWLYSSGIPITASNINKCLRATHASATDKNTPRVKYFSCVPFVLKLLAEDAKSLLMLRYMSIVGVGGAALAQDIGDHLVRSGVKLVSRFGSTECGFLLSSFRKFESDREWQYLRNTSHRDLLFEPRDYGLFELIVANTWPQQIILNRRDLTYATADLFKPHSSIPGAWKSDSRADSQLTLETGKKLDPAPIEDALAASDLLSGVLVFGNGRAYPGALLFPSERGSEKKKEAFMDDIWLIVDTLNASSESHAQLTFNMLVKMPHSFDKPLLRSSKGTILRKIAEERYARDISLAYSNGPTLDLIGLDLGIQDDGLTTVILEIVKRAAYIEGIITLDADLFSLGVDSIACIRIRAALLKLVPAKEGKEQVTLASNIVYDCGSIEKLSKHIIDTRKGKIVAPVDELQLMRDLVDKYGSFDEDPTITKDQKPGHDNTTQRPKRTVVVTGTTGALGAHLLHALSQKLSTGEEVHCLVRAANAKSARERVSKSLVQRGYGALPQLDAESSNTCLIICHPCDFSDTFLGLRASAHHHLISRVTHIIHSAWQVHFGIRLSNFERTHIAGLCNLIEFALACRSPTPRLIFCSSTASVVNANDFPDAISESISHEPLAASTLGYSRSKWVAEAICANAHSKTRLRDKISVLRIGQLCGDTCNSIWNVTEAWPLMLSSVQVTGTLPQLEGQKLDWLPLDQCADAVLEITFADNSGDSLVYHLVNDSTQPTWEDMLSWIEKLYEGEFQSVDPKEWVKDLENLRGDAARHPARKLMVLWKEQYAGSVGSSPKIGARTWDTTHAKKVARVMRSIKPITEEQFRGLWRWILVNVTW